MDPTLALLAFVVATFVVMARGILQPEVGMPLLALLAVSLAGPQEGHKALQEGFSEFSRIALLFTAVAVPAHILQRSQLLDWLGMGVGQFIGAIYASSARRISPTVLVPVFGLTMVFILAALFHNTTSILVSSVILVVMCTSYHLPALPLLCGALVASNLGGFSTRWGDTPNIIEAGQWGLSHADFLMEILPINLGALALLMATVSAWLWIETKRQSTQTGTPWEFTVARVGFRSARRSMSLDSHLIVVGLTGLALAILGPLLFIEYELAFSAAAITVSVLGDYKANREASLLTLGAGTYGTLAAIFVLAHVLSRSSIGIGTAVQDWLVHSGSTIWSIAIASYIGTLLTEAASWASAAAPIVHAHSPSHAGAWALGAGIFAGSSSLVTAASAGIILLRETQRNPPSSRVTFGIYASFGLPISLVMLAFYTLTLSIFYS